MSIYRAPTTLADAIAIIELQAEDIRALLEQAREERALSESRKEAMESLMLRLIGIQSVLCGVGVFAQKTLGQHAVEVIPETWGEYIAISGTELIEEIRKHVAIEVDVRTPKKAMRKRREKQEAA